MKRWLSLFLATALVAGCSQGEQAEVSEEQVEQSQTEEVEQSDGDVKEGNEGEQVTKQPTSQGEKGTETSKEVQPSSPEDTDLTTQLKGEDGISDGKIYVKGDTAYGTIIFEEGVTDAQANQIAKTYAEKIQGKYEGKKVNVQGVRKNGNVVNITL